MLFNLTNLIVISKNSGSILNILTHIRKEKNILPNGLTLSYSFVPQFSFLLPTIYFQ